MSKLLFNSTSNLKLDTVNPPSPEPCSSKANAIYDTGASAHYLTPADASVALSKVRKDTSLEVVIPDGKNLSSSHRGVLPLSKHLS